MKEMDAIAAVTTVPAKALRLDRRIGAVRIGHDADLVVWNKHPLQMAAKPYLVIIHGVSTFEDHDLISAPAVVPSAPQVIFPRAVTEPSLLGPRLTPKPLRKYRCLAFY